MILRLTREQLKNTVIKEDKLYWFDIYINDFLQLSINTDREDLTIRVVDYGFLDFKSLQHGDGINIDLFDEWKDSILMYPDLHEVEQ